MSFILDALKKSESERQRQLSPGLIDPGIVAPRAGLPAWVLVLLTLLGINVLGLSFLLLRRGAPQPLVMRAASQPAKRMADAAPLPRAAAARSNSGDERAAFSPMDNTPQYAPEIPLVEPPIAAQGPASPAGSQSVRARTVGAVAAPATATAPSAAEPDEPLPTIGEIDFGAAGPPPELHLDVHVYAANPAERFVFINGRKYVEGSALQDGLRIERIRRDGVVLNDRGKRFLLPRQ